MKRLCTVCCAVFFFFMGTPCYSAPQGPKAGQRLVHFTLKAPKNPRHIDYLGISGKNVFSIGEIQSEVVIIEIFSMY